MQHAADGAAEAVVIWTRRAVVEAGEAAEAGPAALAASVEVPVLPVKLRGNFNARIGAPRPAEPPALVRGTGRITSGPCALAGQMRFGTSNADDPGCCRKGQVGAAGLRSLT